MKRATFEQHGAARCDIRYETLRICDTCRMLFYCRAYWRGLRKYTLLFRIGIRNIDTDTPCISYYNHGSFDPIEYKHGGNKMLVT